MANQRNFSKLLFSQIPVDLDSPEPFWFGSQGPDESPVMSAPDVPAKSPVTNSCHSVLTGYSHVGRSHGCIWSLSDGVGFTGDGVGIKGVAVEVTSVGVGSTGVVV
ncbi:hypothetical protein HID58_044282 [Brassica napus]|uniref:Uncharacterized protein n=1 Tax=Brassica napus TaxID=3708 RepID=A0ABQ8BIX8_BRANA|nr:hypothetical protein HID58_044282 [Brassica napus]